MMSRKDRKRENLKRAAITGTVAAAAGYVAGVLTAPKSGKQTREDLKTAADNGRAEAEKDLKRAHTELDKVIKEAKTGSSKLGSKAQKELGELVDKAKDTKQKVREVLSAVHEGDAEDRDLQRAVKNANNAVKHLRTYLKK
jgi:gas vesicle protein